MKEHEKWKNQTPEERKKESNIPLIVFVPAVILVICTFYFILLFIGKWFLPEGISIVPDPDPLFIIVPAILIVWFYLAKRGLTGGGEVKGPLDFISIVVTFLTFILFIIGSLFILSDGGSFYRSF